MAKKTSPKRGSAAPKGKTNAKDHVKPRKLPAPESTPKATAKKKKATNAAPRGNAFSNRMLEEAIMAVLSSRHSVASPRLDQIGANLDNRLERKVPRAKLVSVLTSMERNGKLVRHYSSAALVAASNEERRQMINAPAKAGRLKLARPGMSRAAALAHDTTTDSADDDDFNLKDGVRVVLCNEPQVPLSPDQVLERLNDFFGITFDLVPVTGALEDLAELPDGDPERINRAPGGRFSRQCF